MAVNVKWPMPEPIAGVTLKLPSQFVPEPVSVTGTGAPTGGPKLNCGALPPWGGSLNCRLTVTAVVLVACTGAAGAVAMTADGAVTSTTSADPEGAPLKELPAKSVAVSRNCTGPEAHCAVTLTSAS